MQPKREKGSIILSTADFFGNSVSLSSTTWDAHILDEHPQMAGYLTLVEQTLLDPDEINPSTICPFSAAFTSPPNVGPSAEGIRVLVQYDRTGYEVGSATGRIRTAYPIDRVKFRKPKLGPAIYRKGGAK